MQKHDAPSKKAQVIALVTIIAATTPILGCRNETPAPAAPAASTAPAPVSQARSKEQAMAALMALPELKAWAGQIEKSSGGKAHGALIEYDPNPRLIDGKRYYQLSFVENHADAAHHWESFLGADTGDEILVEDASTDKTMTLEQWRAAKNPIARSGPE
jgi:hypothetical protein